ncbi:MAG TPA: glycoside hydrolase family 18 protein [Niabella sp.]|nr:glycoside hydrolase family 18 protein [Niabella sp.]HOZ98382.1 glycoside hydrolase family 18 protein [Niabella sp.]HQW16341.1 glycoside hydrolase family 18 protein [Niabella sp.]HQX21594.1 glycoside hydrolase family 18 protein [Niabella sp.]HQX41988.1 glycoside hydrolase family 18 protein [Niabella sp.]
MKINIIYSFAFSLGILFLINACSKKDTIDIKTPDCAINLAPANGGIVNTTNVLLNWSKVNGATSYDIYLGSSASTATLIAANIQNNSYLHALPSSVNANYFWFVVPKINGSAGKGCTSTATNFKYMVPPAPIGFIVAGYFPSYKTVAEYPDRMFRMCNVVNYAFAEINNTSTIFMAVPVRFDSVYKKARANGAKVFLSINASQANFTMLADAGRRNILIRSIMQTARVQNLDGIDMDYEYPKTTDGTDIVFSQLMKELADSLHFNGKYLSAAITPGKYAGAIRDGIRNELFEFVDFFNVMVYDDFSNSTPFKHHSDMNLVNASINYWLNLRGMPKQKFVLGIPIYGRNSGSPQISTSYKTILARGSQLGPSSIALSDSALLTHSDGSTFTTYYTGQTSVQLKALKAKNETGGMMFWEMGHDANDDNSIIKAACDAIGKAY